MKKKMWLLYIGSFLVILVGFYFYIFKNVDFSQSSLTVINSRIEPFSFTNQNGKIITDKDLDGKVYVTEYFFTTCKAICPKMNANMRRVFDEFKGEKNFMIISHTCMPETDSVPVLKAYEQKMINGKLVQKQDGSYKIEYDSTMAGAVNNNWNFVTGDKALLYRMARHSYLIDDNKTDTTQAIAGQFIHTQLFALVDKQHRVRAIYDGLKEDEIQKLLSDIKGLLRERGLNGNFANGFSNTPN